MNPYDAVGTARVSSALYDRTCRISMGYQDAEQEQIVSRPGRAGPGSQGGRAGPGHPRPPRPAVGSSVRGAIDLARLTPELAMPATSRPTTGRPGSTRPWRRCPAGSGGTSRPTAADQVEEIFRSVRPALGGEATTSPGEDRPPTAPAVGGPRRSRPRRDGARAGPSGGTSWPDIPGSPSSRPRSGSSTRRP